MLLLVLCQQYINQCGHIRDVDLAILIDIGIGSIDLRVVAT